MAIRWTRLLIVLAFMGAGVAGAEAAMAAPHLSSPGGGVVGQDQDGMLPPGDVPPPAPVDEPSADQNQDQDGMLPDGQTPDDDGDGVPDAVDSAPDDPTEGELPPPGPTDPVADNDGDGLPNVMDPDDNNNGLPDADEGVGTDDEVAPAPVTDSPAPVEGAPVSHEEPLVRALPSTGAGPVAGRLASPSLLLLASLLVTVTGGGVSLRRRRA